MTTQSASSTTTINESCKKTYCKPTIDTMKNMMGDIKSSSSSSASTTTTTNSQQNNYMQCPPDINELGRSTWVFNYLFIYLYINIYI